MEIVINNALRFCQSGLSAIPVKKGSKVPGTNWKEFQERIVSEGEVAVLFEGKEVGIICGKVSGNVECLDFDDPAAFDEWEDLVEDHGGGDALDGCYIQQTPSGGTHVVYRIEGDVPGNLKLAMDAEAKVRIETRGEGGYFKCAPSAGYKPRNKNIFNLPTISQDTHELFMASARFLTERVTETVTGPIGPSRDGDSPGHIFNQDANWFDILEPMGWTHAGHYRGRDRWVRPGKKRSEGISATTGNGDGDLLWVFSSNAMPLQHDKSYSKFGAYSFLYHNGDFSGAARGLAEKGYRRAEGVERSEPERQKATPPKSAIALEYHDEDIEFVHPEYAIEPYLPFGKAILADADGGTGKTSLILAIAAWFSNGMSLLGEYGPSEPIKTLYLHKGEDDNKELRTVYAANGGQKGFLALGGTEWNMTPQGCKQLEELIIGEGFRVVVLDPMFAFLQALPQAERLMKDQNAVYQVLGPLMDVYARTGAAGVHIRHTSKGTVGKAASELGMGTAGFRNRHRGQWVMRYHPDKEQHPGVVVLTDEKGSLLTPKGQPFCYKRVGLEIQRVDNIDKDPFEGRQIVPQGKQQLCTDWLRARLETTKVLYVSTIRKEAESEGFSSPQLYKAKNILGLEEDVFAGSKTWTMADYKDPYA